MLITEIITDWITHTQLATMCLKYTDRSTASDLAWMHDDLVSQDDIQTHQLGLQTALDIDKDNINAWLKGKQIPISVLNIKQTPQDYNTLYKVQVESPQIH